ncbi:transcriptional regulator NanR [Falsiroseomonas sp. HW251]|uniref:transcriptional regulator NanR n=1 Tax=Falsiroseomonas sp. HW251 TaxID=3390998 RepID=UPI003D3149A9
MSVGQIQRRKLSEAVLDRLMDRIGAGEFPPGSQLPSERDLMEAYGVGRPAVREALQSLERSGIINITHGERARVAVPSAAGLVAQIAGGAQHLMRIAPGSVEHLKEARVFLEAGLARLAAERASDDGVVALGALIEQQRRARARPRDFVNADMAFHRQIAAMTGNPIFPAVVEAMFGWLGAHHRSLVRAPGAESLTLAEHERIVAAIEARDPAQAEAAMRDHLTRANALYGSLLRREAETAEVTS